MNHTYHPAIDALHKIRVEREISRRQLARISGYSHRTLEYWEKKRWSPPLRSLVDWAEALGVSVHISIRRKP